MYIFKYYHLNYLFDFVNFDGCYLIKHWTWNYKSDDFISESNSAQSYLLYCVRSCLVIVDQYQFTDHGADRSVRGKLILGFTSKSYTSISMENID